MDNLTNFGVPESLLNFFIAPFGEPFTGDILGGELFAGETRFIGTFAEDVYDAEGDLEFGQIIEWLDIFVGNGENAFFEVL